MAESLRSNVQRRNVEPPRFTYGDYIQWQGDERWELIDGEAYLMSPAPSRAHQRILFEMARQVADALEDQPCEVNLAPFDVRFPHQDEADEDVDTVLQPDLVVICDLEKLDDAGARGAPDWVVEILSPSTTSRDRVAKRLVYERHGVREYWVVDPKTRQASIHVLDDGGYSVRDAQCEGNWGPECFPGLEIRWRVVFGWAD